MMAVADDDGFFQRLISTCDNRATLYERTAGTTGPAWVGFAAFTAGRHQEPEQVTFGEAWANYLGLPRAGVNGGVYVIAGSRPIDFTSYLNTLVGVVVERNKKFDNFAYRFLFFGDPTGSTSDTLVAEVVFATSDAAQPGTVIGWNGSTTTITTRNIGIIVAHEARIAADSNAASLRLSAYGANNIKLLANKYEPATISTLTSDVTLPLDGITAGTLRFGLTLTQSDPPARGDFALLDVGLKYVTERAGRIHGQRFPVLGPTTDKSVVPFQVSYDPLRPLAHDRTSFTFGDGKNPCVAMESGLLDPNAHPVRLVPLTGQARLVVQEDRVTVKSVSDPQVDTYYLAPDGPFALAPGSSTPQATRVMCGLSPLEAVVFDPPGSVMTFHADQPAFSPLLAQPVPADRPRLTDRYRTSWVTVCAEEDDNSGPSPVFYLAQPVGGALYGHVDDQERPYLGHKETPAAVLRGAEAEKAFPLVPYGRIVFGDHPDTFTGTDVTRLEREVLAVERRARIADSASRPSPVDVAEGTFASDGTSKVMTPQGFVVELGDSGAWRRVSLAQTVSSENSSAETGLGFENVDDTLRAALQTNQQFLVITQPKVPWTGAGTVFHDELRPQGWPFHVRVGTGSNPGDYRNVLLLKFCDGTLEDRVRDHRRWTAAESFNSEPADVADWLRAYIDQAKALAIGSDGEYFKAFVSAVTSPSWRGILALRVDVDASALPGELRGLAAGIRLEDFNAHHVGVELSFVDTSGGGLESHGNSSLFACVYYVDPAYAAGLDVGASPELPVLVSDRSDYAFRVLSLKTRFVNAEIAAFASKAQITFNRLFGDKVRSLTLHSLHSNWVAAPSNSLVLDGAYQNHDGVGVFTFASSADARFLLVSNIWRGVEVVAASFATLRSPPAGKVASRFTLRGFLDFAVLHADDGSALFDLLSFGGEGTETDPSGTGLPFSELHLDMTFDTASPGTPAFDFRVEEMTFAPTVDHARQGSLYARMPLTLTGIVAGTSGTRDLGFLTASPLNLPTAPLGNNWHGLVYTLDLGTLGALAAKVGLTARLLVAWAPQSQGTRYRVAVGLALPGAGGTAHGLSLQGVLTLTVDRVLLTRDATSGTFVLRLTNLLLSLLGVRLPPGTSTAILVFGNPDPKHRDTVGWYAAVNREKKAPLPAELPGGR